MNAIIERPRFVWWLAPIVQLPLELFLSVWIGGIFGGLAKNLLGYTGASLQLPLGLAAFVAIPCITVLGKKASYGQIEYIFFDDHVEIVEGYFSRQMKSVAYVDIREVTLRRGLLQRGCGLGSVYLGTLATGSGSQFDPFSALAFASVTASGVTARDLPEPDAAYAEIRRRIEIARRMGRDAL